MISKTRMLGLVRDLRWRDVKAGLSESPKLLGFRDARGRNWLHLCCSVNPKKRGLKAADSIKTAEVLLRAGLDINREAFREESWKATPLWYAVSRSRGHNFALARYLLGHGSDPNHCLWAAAFGEDPAMIELLVKHGAELDPVHEDATPFLHAVQWSRFRGAVAMLEHGADPDFQDSHGMTALHYMLKKGSDARHFRMLVEHGARGDLPNEDGITAAEMMARKRSPAFRRMAEQLATG